MEEERSNENRNESVERNVCLANEQIKIVSGVKGIKSGQKKTKKQ